MTNPAKIPQPGDPYPIRKLSNLSTEKVNNLLMESASRPLQCKGYKIIKETPNLVFVEWHYGT